MKVFTPWFESLTAREAYDVMAAVRGPDAGYLRVIKRLITARIRAMVFTYHDSIGGIIQDRCFSADDMQTLEDTMRTLQADARSQKPLVAYNTLAHFIDHLRVAVYASKDRPMWGGYGDAIHHQLYLWPLPR